MGKGVEDPRNRRLSSVESEKVLRHRDVMVSDLWLTRDSSVHWTYSVVVGNRLHFNILILLLTMLVYSHRRFPTTEQVQWTEEVLVGHRLPIIISLCLRTGDRRWLLQRLLDRVEVSRNTLSRLWKQHWLNPSGRGNGSGRRSTERPH